MEVVDEKLACISSAAAFTSATQRKLSLKIATLELQDPLALTLVTTCYVHGAMVMNYF